MNRMIDFDGFLTPAQIAGDLDWPQRLVEAFGDLAGATVISKSSNITLNWVRSTSGRTGLHIREFEPDGSIRTDIILERGLLARLMLVLMGSDIEPFVY